MIEGQGLDLAACRRPLGLDQAPPVDLLTGLFGQGRQHRDGAGSASDGDREAGGDEVADRVVEIVGESPEDRFGVLSAEADGEPSDVRADRPASTPPRTT